jgi:predicted transcriptional regulator
MPVEDQAAFRAAVREGIEAADAGKLSPFEPVAEGLASWGAENELGPPE